MNSGVQNLLLSLGLMQAARKIPFDDPQVLTYVQVGYVVVQIVTLAVYYYASLEVKKKNDQTVLKYVEPQAPMSTEPGELVTITVRDYDLSEISKLLRAVYFGVALMGVLHLYFKFNPPLFIQGIMGLKNLYDNKIVSLHIFGRPAEGDLKRPFKTPPGLLGGAAGPQTDSAAITEAEKRVGSKKED